MRGSRAAAGVLLATCLLLSGCGHRWKSYDLRDGSWVKFPMHPLRHTTPIKTKGGKTTITLYQCSIKNRSYFAGSYPLPEGTTLTPAELLDAERDRGMENSGFYLVSDDPFKEKTYEGRELILDSTKLPQRIRCRNFIVGKRLHTLFVVGGKDKEADEATVKFFASFSVS